MKILIKNLEMVEKIKTDVDIIDSLSLINS